ncbi:hypothetical protein KIF24_10125 [Micromonospora sp. Llam7]|uniref:hypothetical protein n=1 Tax=Micromonospora tarapacensis TaxID=2835305 RepID=UPI001C82AE66|nr:hypothetical protein [Micromonospora tarapacensis]MBX7266348.1 hypothetical protein [Micromonospora tarapacensis]
MTALPYRLSDGLVRFVAGGAYILEGGPTRVVFADPGASEVMPRLCELLDGRHYVPQIAHLLRVPVAEVTDKIALLARHGLVRPVTVEASGPARSELPTPATDFLSRAAGYPAGPGHLLVERRPGHALVAGRGWLAATIIAELDRSGITVGPYDCDVLAGMPSVSAGGWPSVIVVEVLGGDPPSALAATLRAGQWWLGARVDARGGSVGPLLRPGLSCACPLPALTRPDGAGPAATTVDLIAALTAGEVVHAFSRGAPISTLAACVEICCADGAPVSTSRRLLRRLDCPDCGGGHGGEHEAGRTTTPPRSDGPRHVPPEPDAVPQRPAQQPVAPVRPASSG